MIGIHLASVFVTDQERAKDFYTRVLGFELRQDMDLGPGGRWLTVGNPGQEASSGVPAVELLLEPAGHPAVGPYQEALVADGIPATSFSVDDVEAEHARLVDLGVTFIQPPTAMGPVTTAVLDDTCGNLIQLAQMNG
ncbi:VOC family protein [Demequina sp. NBRC 110053]|uniref:VOC family protein n=1 Tax=Demequina sp. NBRC 110053 TaxID=1570342 RepID=UPI00190EFC2C|nr:VOC family protein [Demequina sp. NBRC 110053]